MICVPNVGIRGLAKMPGNSFGELFRITTAGVSHGPGYLLIVDGCPPGLPLSVDDLMPDLRRRRPGQSKIVTQRQEPDVPEIRSGVFDGKTDGTPIGILFRNEDQRSQDYTDIKDKYRPGMRILPSTPSTAVAITVAEGGPARGKPCAGWRPPPSPRNCWPSKASASSAM